MSGFRFTIPQNAFAIGAPALAIDVVPDKGLAASTKPRILHAKFGDGYSQSVTDGINPIETVYNMAFQKRPRAEIDNIEAFFLLMGGVQTFNLTLSDYRDGIIVPNEKIVKVVATSWIVTYLYDNYYACTAIFERRYTP